MKQLIEHIEDEDREKTYKTKDIFGKEITKPIIDICKWRKIT